MVAEKIDRPFDADDFHIGRRQFLDGLAATGAFLAWIMHDA